MGGTYSEAVPVGGKLKQKIKTGGGGKDIVFSDFIFTWARFFFSSVFFFPQ